MAISEFFGEGLLFTLGGLKTLYIIVSLFAWTISLLFAPRYLSHDKHKGRFYVFSLITLAATVGVFAAGDLFTLFTFFEIMSLASYVWVAQEEKNKALKAADTYMAVAVIGGLVLLMGILLLYTNVGTLKLSELKEACETGGRFGRGRIYAAAFCMFFGFAAKAGAFPIHIWLPKAHPVAPAPASALLSGVLTKAGVFGILIVCYTVLPEDALWGSFVMGIGIITMVLGAMLALFSTDIKRTLACSSVSQIGFIIVGCACGTLLGAEAALVRYGIVLHMVNHTVVKLCVFLVAGVVYQNLHSLDLNVIRGFGKKKSFLGLSFALGGMSLAGIPGFLGYLSKTALHEGLLEAGEVLGNEVIVKGVEAMFLFSGGCTLAYMLKLFTCVFVEKNVDAGKQEKYDGITDYMGIVQKAAVAIPALLVLGLGITIAIRDEYSFFNLEIMSGSFISIAIGLFMYFVFVRKFLMSKSAYLNLWPKWLDMEEKVYKPLLVTLLPTAFGFLMRFLDEFTDRIVLLLRKTVYRDSNWAPERIEGTWYTHLIGHAADLAKSVKTGEVSYDIEHKLALKHMENQENKSLAQRSLSYGLILACGGMFLMLGFILYLVFAR
ncbi:MAG: NADH dehydrogenase [Lachnospiraceae bacterium]|nr:NADH dehydrogenase [Lachnospiraceae bacterium]